MNGRTDALLHGLRAELGVWHSDQGKGERLAYRLRVDPRCLVIEAARGGPTRPTIRHVDNCTCGMF